MAKNRNWYVDWFNSPYYHILYKDRNKEEAELFIDNLISYLKIIKGSKLIDIACGKGRHATYLNKHGLDVIGYDLSINSIKYAKKYENKTLKFHVHDMRKVLKKDHFEYATNLFTSFGYFENEKDEQITINAMAGNLKNEGTLIIDFMNTKKVISNLTNYENKEVNCINFKIERSVHKKNIIKNIKFSDNGKDYIYNEQVKALTLDDFYNLITKAKLKIIDIFGNYQLDNFNAKTSDRLIIICKK